MKTLMCLRSAVNTDCLGSERCCFTFLEQTVPCDVGNVLFRQQEPCEKSNGPYRLSFSAWMEVMDFA